MSGIDDDHHHHDHDHDHDHDHSDVPEELALRAKALLSLLVDKGFVDAAEVDRLIDTMEHEIGPHLGARIVAKSWVDPAFRQLLLDDARAAAESLGIGGWRHDSSIVALANSATSHHVVVCTLCSCYPTNVLGPPPVWYKSAPYRSRAVLDPRGVLEEFGTTVGDGVELRVWDSTAEVRYLVVPERPSGTEGWTEEQLATLVTRNSMIGVERARTPETTS